MDAYGPAHPAVRDAYDEIGMEFGRVERWAEAEEHLRVALDMTRERYGDDHLRVGNATRKLGWVTGNGGDLEPAVRLSRRAVELLRSAPGAELLAREASGHLRNWLRRLGRHAEAAKVEAEQRRVELAQLVAEGAAPARRAEFHSDYGRSLRRVGRLAEAEAQHRTAVALCESALGPRDPDTLHSTVFLGITLMHQERHEEAEPLLREAVVLHDEVLGPENRSSVELRMFLGECLAALGRFDEAERRLEESLERIDDGWASALVARRNLARICL